MTEFTADRARQSRASEISGGARHAADRGRRTFVALDGMRGVAALTVILWHLPGPKLLASAYLAVDLFFMLSGFVLAYRYHDKLCDGREARTFIVMRAIRLYPLYLIGSILGFAAMWWSAGGHLSFGLGERLVMALLALPILSAHGLVFPLNVPAWSLFYEFLVNILFGFTNRRMGYRGLIFIIGMFGALMVAMLVLVGHLQFTGQMPKFLFAGIRTMFGFYLGVLIYRRWSEGKLPAWRLHPIAILVAVALLLAAPAAPPIGPFLTFGIVFLAFPFLVVAGIENEPTGATARLMSWLGVLSFPLYAVHYPIVMMLERSGMLASTPLGALVAVAASIAVASLSLKVWDAPLRGWLTRLHRRARA